MLWVAIVYVTGFFLTGFSLALRSDVDTDLYKLIMSPQYLTTEHIQVSIKCTYVCSM